MDWQFKVGIGLAVMFGLLPYAVKDLPHWISWPGIVLGLLFVLWGLALSYATVPHGPAFLFIAGITLAASAVGWYRDSLTPASPHKIVSSAKGGDSYGHGGA